MSILVNCPQCGTSHNVNDALAGRRVRCPQCDTAVHVPELDPDAPVEVELVEVQRGDSTGDEVEVAEAAVVEINPWEENDAPDAHSQTTGGLAVGGVPVEAVPVAGTPQSPPPLPGAVPAVPAQPPELPTEVATTAIAEIVQTQGGDIQLEEPEKLSLSDSDDDDEALPPRKPRDDDELDMTPMVDVTFLLLIFFMVTASFSLQKSIQMPRQQTDAPSTTVVEEEEEDLETVECQVDEFGSFLVISADDWERETPGKQNLITTLREAIEGHGPMRLVIKIQEQCKLQFLVDAMDAGTIAGYTETQVTQVEEFD